VFKRFWRKDRGDGDGAGLGLAIAAKIVEAHGGHVSLADAPGGGAIFAIDLLRAAQPARTAEGEHA
jgi:two-component system OmpR family sensor kinase